MTVDLMRAVSLAYENRDIARFKKLVVRWAREERKSRSKRRTMDDAERFREAMNRADQAEVDVG